MSKPEGLTICPFCKEPLPKNVSVCPYCAEPLESVTPSSERRQPDLANTENKASVNIPPVSVDRGRKIFRICGLSLALLLVVVVVAEGYIFLHENRFWPFATGTSNAAFLGTTFGMSPQEVRRALKSEGAQLVSYDEYKRMETTHMINIFDMVDHSEDNQYADLCMPSIQMFDTSTEALFTFRLSRLESVTVYFWNYNVSNALKVVESVKLNLLNFYKFSQREDSGDVPGAYRLLYDSNAAHASFWVNLSDPKKPYVTLTLWELKSQEERKQQLKDRDRKAFGPAN
jgi:hypothetical protein